MKRLLLILLISLTGMIFMGCLPDADFSIRVENNFALDFLEFNVGTVQFGEVPSGEITDYKPIEEGSHTVTASMSEDEDSDLSEMEIGSFSISARTGSHKYTIEVTSGGGLELHRED